MRADTDIDIILIYHLNLASQPAYPKKKTLRPEKCKNTSKYTKSIHNFTKRHLSTQKCKIKRNLDENRIAVNTQKYTKIPQITPKHQQYNKSGQNTKKIIKSAKNL